LVWLNLSYVYDLLKQLDFL